MFVGVVATTAVMVAVATVLSMVRVGPVIAAAGPVLPLRSVRAFCFKRGISVPALHPETANVIVRLSKVGVKTQPVAVPAFSKSDAASEAGAMFSLVKNVK